MGPVRVVVVDDHEIVRAGLSALLSREPDIHVVGAAASGEEGLRMIDELAPDVAVVDYRLGGMSGVEVCEKATAHHPDLPVIILSTFLDDDVIHRSIQAGARAYVYKDVEGHELKRTIRTVAKGQAVLDPKVTGRVIRMAVRRRFEPSEKPLSVREVEVFRHIVDGLSDQQIAQTMGVTKNTVKTYVRRALAKLGCRSRTEATAIVLRRSLL